MVTLAQIAAFLDDYFETRRYADEPPSVYHPSAHPIDRFGLALEPWPGLPAWFVRERLDALFLHRPWKLDHGELPPDTGVLAYHLPFDERMTLGFNPRRARELGLVELETIGDKAGRPLGIIGATTPRSFAGIRGEVDKLFGGVEAATPGNRARITRVAIVGAMTDSLVHEAAARGAELYLTGQLRVPARPAFAETGIGALAVGHRRSELWGVRSLAAVLHEQWPDLYLSVAPNR
jgi:putative NIF3 family GTP cyclohydrolase 1 type 2